MNVKSFQTDVCDFQRVNMAFLRVMFIFLMCFVVRNFGEVTSENVPIPNENHQPEITAVLDHLNSGPVKVYNYRDGILIDAHKKADITEIRLEVKFNCIKSYPELPCSENTLICHGFVQVSPDEICQVLGDVKCLPKNSMEEQSTTPSDGDGTATISPDFDTSTNVELESFSIPEIRQSVALSNEAASSEAGEHFVAVRKNAGPCFGCPFDLNPDVPGVTELVNTALSHVESEKTQKHALVKVLKIQRQIVSGVEYILLVQIAPTTCPKNYNKDPAPCPLDSTADSFICKVIFLQKPWISKAKHIISNNCTMSQEYVILDLPVRNDIDNEIEVNNAPKPFPGDKIPANDNNNPNFDHIAESGVIEDSEMNPERLADLESQIMLVEPKALPVPVEKLSPKYLDTFEKSTIISHDSILPKVSTGYSSEFVQENPASDVPERIVIEDIIVVKPTFVTLYSETEGPQIFNIFSSSPSFESQATEDRPENGTPKTEEAINLDISTTVTALTEETPDNRGLFSVDTVASVIEGIVKFKHHLKNESSSESNSSSASSEEKDRPNKNSSAESSGEDLSRESEESHESQERMKRPKRAVRQLEKISPDEKGLVKDLADYAAAALDSIDDDNYKRVVLQILGAKKMMGDGVYYHLILRLGISHCLEDKPPAHNCREKLFENYTKICKVQVHIGDDPYSHPKVVKSQCQNIKKDKNDSNRTNYSRFRRDVLVGGQTQIEKDSPKVKHIVAQTLTKLDAQSGLNNKYKATEVVSATSQVVAGVLYRVKVKIAQSDCAKTDAKDVASCSLLESAQEKTCDIEVWDRPWLHNTSTTVKCENEDKPLEFQLENLPRTRRSVPGGISDADNADERVLEYLKKGLDHLDSYSEHANKLIVEEVVSATKQVVSGTLHRIKAKIALSDCKKGSNASQCNKLDGAKSRICDFKAWDQPWLPHGLQINITCEDDQSSYTYRSKRDVSHHHVLGKGDHDKHFSMFKRFIKDHNKIYSSKKEFKYRFRVFMDNMKYVSLLNKYEQGTGKYGVTKFADLTRKEFSQSLGLRMDLHNENEVPLEMASIPDINLPTEFDWRKKKVISEVKDQGQCGSCWAFSVTGNIEGQYAIKHGQLLEFSEQELVDCDTVDEGCNGGLMDNAYRVIEKLGGLETESDYPYDAEDEKCHFNASLARVQLTGAVNISHDETDMAKWLVNNGPISIAINANAMQFYVGGVSHPFKFLCSPNNLDHGVLIVGYGVHTYPMFKKSLPYWIVKNSWGKSWGEQGYYRVYRGDGTCGLNQTPSSGIVA